MESNYWYDINNDFNYNVDKEDILCKVEEAILFSKIIDALMEQQAKKKEDMGKN